MKTLFIKIIPGCLVMLLLASVAGFAQKTFTVNSTVDSPDAVPGDGICADALGLCTLRAAIDEANASGGADVINFFGSMRIQPIIALPQLSDNAGVTIDGLAGGVGSAGANAPSTASLNVEIDGTLALIPNFGVAEVHGFHIISDNNTIQGLIINHFRGDGIRIEGTTGYTENNLVYCNFIGTNQAGTADYGNGTASSSTTWYAGVEIIVPPCELIPVFAKNNTVRRCLISGNGYEGVSITNCPPGDNHNNTVEYNYIGVTKDGNSKLQNDHDGVTIAEAAHDNVIDHNVISGNGYSGVGINGLSSPERFTKKNTISNNIIGLNAGATAAIANGYQGISIGMYGPNTWGYAPDNTVQYNTIAYNGANGVLVYEIDNATDANCDGNLISQNSIYSNNKLGIDLGDNSVTFNDFSDPDVGANQECNFPVISSATISGGTTTITGTIDSPSPNTGTVEVFKSDNDASGYGEGQTYLNQGTPNAAGNWSVTTAVALTTSDILTATFTDASKNTSEFSANFSGIALPLELLSFRAEPVKAAITLTWTTANELDMACFQLERSSDSKSFREVAWIDSKGDPAENAYEWLDREVVPLVRYYYRLEMVNCDGSLEFSPVRSARLEAADVFQLYPNPSAGIVSVVFADPEEAVTQLEVLNYAGQMIKIVPLLSQSGGQTIELDLRDLPSGLYVFRAKMRGKYLLQKLSLEQGARWKF